MKNKIEIAKDWEDELIWCPSQCYLKLKCGERFFIIYIRWRWNDPWTARLIECDDDFNMHNKKYEWIEIRVAFWTDEQLEELKKEAFKLAKKMIKKITKDE